MIIVRVVITTFVELLLGSCPFLGILQILSHFISIIQGNCDDSYFRDEEIEALRY